MSRRAREYTDLEIQELRGKPDTYQKKRLPPNLYLRFNKDRRAQGWVVMARGPDGRQVWKTLDRHHPAMTKAEAQVEKDRLVPLIRAGSPLTGPVEEAPSTLAAVVEAWAAVQGRQQYRWRDKEYRLQRFLVKEFGTIPFADLKLKAVSDFLDRIAIRTARTADMVRTDLQAVEKWWVKGGRAPEGYVQKFAGIPKRCGAAPRERVLEDAELKLLWAAAIKAGQFGRFLKLLLLTAQRREKVGAMAWDDINLDTGVWTIPTVAAVGLTKPKGHPKSLTLPPLALDLVKAQRAIQSGPWVFGAARGGGHMNSFGTLKAEFDRMLPKDMPKWTLHDLRRTARTEMEKIRNADGTLAIEFACAEAILGHKLSGVAGTYARHGYIAEMVPALVRLADYIKGIVDPEKFGIVEVPVKAA
jgi:integrase